MVFQQWDLLLFVFERQVEPRSCQHVVMEFPHWLYRDALADSKVSHAWLALLRDVGVALAGAQAICGSGTFVPIDSLPLDMMKARIREALMEPGGPSRRLHTALWPSSGIDQEIEARAIQLGFRSSEVAPAYRMLTSLPALEMTSS